MLNESDILYEDNHVIVVYKPAGMLVQGDDTKDPTLIDQVKYYLKQKYQKPGNVFLGMVHRLDRPVCGIIIFAKTSKAAARLSEQFRTHTIQKIYHAVVEGDVTNAKATLIHYLEKDTDKNFVKVYDSPTQGALRAELSYELVESKKKKSLLRIELKTGRPHQIRSQLAHICHPIVGDVKYGAQPIKEIESFGQKHSVIALCATSLEFDLITGEQRKKIEIDLPKEWDF